ncbi:ATP-dependent protease ATPase subunit HslU [Treponema parvum]|uniref:ATP-dependent protease ATPase subunit HslU n=1 Tax=Treponema parvum TaxID=138851 RepID=A0A975F0F3_9SPIR|nr:ATP-dependent protease ATPase subunit HslU [Treponema parvum]QTQ12063.1 ATP-dependent protease ATPase subunit HslU [Treponema parvum]
MEDLTPRQIVEKLDMYVIGQHKAKRAVAIALRNRSRRLKLPEDIRDEIAPKNILMIGPTGVGKTEIARRLAKLCNAPFLKVEATKYTEVGYVGRDVESMIRDLMAVGYNDVKAEMQEKMREQSGEKVEERLLDLLLPGSGEKENKKDLIALPPGNSQTASENAVSTREKFRQMLRDGKLEDREVELSIDRRPQLPNMEIIAGGNMDDLESGIRNLTSFIVGGKSHRRTVTVKEARRLLTEEVLDGMVDHDKVAEIARQRVEQSGIIFIDEIDKIAVKGERSGQDVSREGVQRDILPIVEGSNVNTKYGIVDTTHILFIAAGAFSIAAPSDLIPELQGRFPLRVELDSLHKDDFRRILTEPKNALTYQYTALLSTEGVTVKFSDDAIERMSALGEEVNAMSENIGARRLHTIMEKVLDEISFSADEHKGETIVIDSAYVDERLKDISQNQDLSRYIL